MPCGREIRLRRMKSLRRWGIYFISLDAKRQISQFAEQIISPWAKRTISLFIWIKRFEYWARSVSRLGAPRCLRQMKRCSEQEETTSIATRSSSSVAPYHSFPPLAKTHSLRTSSSPQNASILGHPPLQGDYVSDRKGRWFHYTFGAWKNEVASLMKCGQTAWKNKRCALLHASIASTSLQRSCRLIFAEQTLHLLKYHCTKWILFN